LGRVGAENLPCPPPLPKSSGGGVRPCLFGEGGASKNPACGVLGLGKIENLIFLISWNRNIFISNQIYN